MRRRPSRRVWVAGALLAVAAAVLARVWFDEPAAPPREVWVSMRLPSMHGEVRTSPEGELIGEWEGVWWRGGETGRTVLALCRPASRFACLWSQLSGKPPTPREGFAALPVEDVGADPPPAARASSSPAEAQAAGRTLRDSLEAELARPRRHLVEQAVLPAGLTPQPEFVGRWVCEDLRGVLELRADGTATSGHAPGVTRRWAAEGRILWMENFREPGPAAAPVTLACAAPHPYTGMFTVLRFATGDVGRRME